MKTKFLISAALAMPAVHAYAHNPVIQTIYTADPAPVVHDGTLYLYSSHDEDAGEIGNFNLKNWVLATTTDMVNWTQHGQIASLRDFKWAGSGWGGGFENGAWAPQAIERDGKWYMYCPLQGRGIGVLVADNPYGPFTDPIGKPLIGGQYDSIDPTVYIDDQGQGYLAWGNPNLWSVKLNKDMISYDTSVGENGIIRHPMTIEALGERTKPDKNRGTSYEEAPWLYKRKNLYYLFFAGGPIPEHLGYSTGPTPEGPWTYGGVVMAPPDNSFTIHPGVVDYKGKTYLFYHNGTLPGGDGFKRSVCVDELKFNPDGSIPMVQPTKQGPAPVGTLDPYKRVEAETIAWESGVKTAQNDTVGVYVTGIDKGDFIRVCNVDFGKKGPSKFLARVASASEGGEIELRLDGEAGPLVATLGVVPTGGAEKWFTQTCPVNGASGIHDVYFKFTGGNSMSFDWWKFEPAAPK